MTISEKISEYNRKKGNLQAEARQLKAEFENYLVDTTIPLELRWETFIQADNDFKNHSDWYFRPKTKGLQYIKDVFFDAPEVYGRGKRIYWSDALEDYFRDGEFHFEDFATSYESLETSEKLLREAMEEILASNQGSFCIDW